MGHSPTVTIWIEDVQTGAVCTHAVFDPCGVLLLGQATEITQEIIDGLIGRGIDRVEVDPRDAEALGIGRTDQPSPPTRKPTASTGKPPRLPTGKPLKDRLVDRFDEPLDLGRQAELKQGYADASDQLDELRDAITRKKLQTVEAVDDLTRRFADFLIRDHDQTVGAFGGAQASCELAERCVKLASVGMAVGVEMGLDGLAVTQLGTAGLLHDVGLFSMDDKFHVVGPELTEDERWAYQKHPIVSQQCLTEVGEIPNQVRIAIEQVHEQYNGDGYPRGLEGKRIHPYARILNVVDAYLQLILPTSRRPGVMPHDAIGVLLHQARHGLFEPQVVRAFLLTETLFPLGSNVELSDGTVAKVIRRPRDGYATPVLQTESGDRVDLCESPLRITRPALSGEAEQIRVTQEMMGSMQWEPIRPVTAD